PPYKYNPARYYPDNVYSPASRVADDNSRSLPPLPFRPNNPATWSSSSSDPANHTCKPPDTSALPKFSSIARSANMTSKFPHYPDERPCFAAPFRRTRSPSSASVLPDRESVLSPSKDDPRNRIGRRYRRYGDRSQIPIARARHTCKAFHPEACHPRRSAL